MAMPGERVDEDLMATKEPARLHCRRLHFVQTGKTSLSASAVVGGRHAARSKSAAANGSLSRALR
jgi:hypothetical protein